MNNKIDINRIVIRKAQKNDAEAILNSTIDVLNTSDYLISTIDEFKFTIHDEEVWIENFEKNKLDCLFVVEFDSVIIGNLSFITLKQRRVSHVGELSMAIIDKYRNIGIGTKLLNYFFEYIKIQNFNFIKINLSVIEDNINAIALYKKFNFETEGCLKKSVIIDKDYKNLLIMSKTISNQK